MDAPGRVAQRAAPGVDADHFRPRQDLGPVREKILPQLRGQRPGAAPGVAVVEEEGEVAEGEIRRCLLEEVLRDDVDQGPVVGERREVLIDRQHQAGDLRRRAGVPQHPGQEGLHEVFRVAQQAPGALRLRPASDDAQLVAVHPHIEVLLPHPRHLHHDVQLPVGGLENRALRPQRGHALFGCPVGHVAPPAWVFF
jgi:hypothetical protein